MTSKNKSKNKTDLEGFCDDVNASFQNVAVDYEHFKDLSRTNLTGIDRQRKDKAAEVNNAVAKWKAAHDEGRRLVVLVANKKLEFIFSKEEGDDEIPDYLEKDLRLLEKVIGNLEEIVFKLEALNLEFCALDRLHSISTVFEFPGYCNFANITEFIYSEFVKDLKLKKSIYENVAHVKSRNQMMLYVSAWTNQPFINAKEIEFNVALMLKKSGHG